MSRARRVAFWTLREWMEVLAGEKAVKHTGQWLSEETHEAFREYRVGIKGPLTAPVGGGIRSLNVALPQPLDFYACVRPVRHFSGVPSPVRDPRKVDMVVFRENTEDMYAGFELEGEKEEIAVLWITSVPLTDGGSGPIQRSGSNPLADRAAAGSFGQPSTMPSGTAEGASPWSRKGTSRSSRKGPS